MKKSLRLTEEHAVLKAQQEPTHLDALVPFSLQSPLAGRSFSSGTLKRVEPLRGQRGSEATQEALRNQARVIFAVLKKGVRLSTAWCTGDYDQSETMTQLVIWWQEHFDFCLPCAYCVSKLTQAMLAVVQPHQLVARLLSNGELQPFVLSQKWK